jgi:hypothetical protein
MLMKDPRTCVDVCCLGLFHNHKALGLKRASHQPLLHSRNHLILARRHLLLLRWRGGQTLLHHQLRLRTRESESKRVSTPDASS